jgi:transposase-like protein
VHHIRYESNVSEVDSQHYLLSAKARTLDTKRVARMTEDEAYNAFVSIRYAETDGQPFCPWCNCAANYKIKTRRKFKCQSCLRQFSVTSGTIFASRKMSFRDMLYAIAMFANGAKGISALQLSRLIHCQYKTAYVLAHKLREALSALQAENELGGEVEIDGAYFGGYVKPGNEAKLRRDRRKLANQSGKRKCVVIMRERGGKSRPFVCSEREGASLAARHITPGSIVYADEAKDYDNLHAVFDMKRIDHSKRYAEGTTSTNQAESFFSRLRRAEVGTHHHISRGYTDTYAGEMSWREDNRRISNGEQFLTIVSAGLHHPVSRRWKAYWQRSKAA